MLKFVLSAMIAITASSSFAKSLPIDEAMQADIDKSKREIEAYKTALTQLKIDRANKINQYNQYLSNLNLNGYKLSKRDSQATTTKMNSLRKEILIIEGQIRQHLDILAKLESTI